MTDELNRDREIGRLHQRKRPWWQWTLPAAMVCEAISGGILGSVVIFASRNPWYGSCGPGDICDVPGGSATRVTMIVLGAVQLIFAVVVLALLSRAHRGGLRERGWAAWTTTIGALRICASQVVRTHPGFGGVSINVVAALSGIEVIVGLVALVQVVRATS